MTKLSLPLALTLAGCVLAAAGSAAADTGRLASPEAAALLGRVPAGYVQVIGSPVTIGAGLQERAHAFCPAGTVPVGGGGVISSSDVRANLNSSIPTPTGWAIDVNNGSAASTTASASVICIVQPRQYQLVQVNGFTNPHGSESAATVSCPTGTAVFGGGALSTAADVNVNLADSFPLATGNGWRADVNNGSSDDHTITAFAICARPSRHYAVVSSGDASAVPGTQASASVSCAGTSVPLGGGVISSADNLQINANSLRPESHGWTAFVNDASRVGGPFDARVVCA
jgi:hypothetical protein